LQTVENKMLLSKKTSTKPFAWAQNYSERMRYYGSIIWVRVYYHRFNKDFIIIISWCKIEW